MGMNYIHELNKNINRQTVRYPNRYGMMIGGDLYTKKNLDKNKKYPAIIVGAPYGGVKEQGPCVYADELARRGFIVLTFDQSFMGESSGEPRNVSSPDIFTENFSAAVDFLGVQNFVDRNKIGVIGMCGSGGFALSAAQTDMRIKAVVTASMYDMTKAVRLGLDEKELMKTKEKLSLQRWIDFKNNSSEYIPSFPESPLDAVPTNMPEPDAEWFRF